MSKSDENPASFISVLDDPKTIEKKFKRAVTDSGSEVKFSEQNPGIANLMTIYSVLNGKDFQSIENEFQGKLYGHLKIAVAETVIAALKPAQDKYHDLMKHPEHLDALMQKGATKARMRAQKTLSLVYERMGIL